jgi:hypothetical protein
MGYAISGRVCARPCDGFEVPISNGRITLFRQSQEGRQEIDGTDRRLDENGEFEEIELHEEAVEPGEAIIVDVWVENPCQAEAEKVERTHVTLTTFEFARREESRRFEWCFTPDQYCQLMQELGCRYVCGQVTDCDTGNPIPGLEVEAFDADIVQPDPLGTDTTDSNGWYLIYYSRADFEETPAQFAPIELIGGPDLFFTIQYGSNTLLDESPSEGRQSDRENADHCEHVDLCVEFPDPGPIAAAWLRVGRYQIPDSNSLKDFDKEGYTASKKYAFYSTLPLEGSVPVRNVPISGAGSNPVRYRFKVGTSQIRNGAQGTASQFNRIVDHGNDLFVGVHVGTLVYQTQNQVDTIAVEVEPGDLKTGGWVRVDEAIRDAYQARQNDPSTPSPLASLGSYKWSPTDQLARLNTEHKPDESNTEAGDPVPGSPPIDDEHFAIRFEVQERVNNTWQNLPGHGRTLNRITINNNGEFRKFGVVQLEQDLCQPITTENADLKYTLYHPHLEGAELEIRRNDQNNWTTLKDPATELSFFNVSSTDSKYDHNYNDRFDIASHVDEECAYMVRLRSRRRLTTGRSADGWNSDLLAFCAREP